MDLSKNLEQSSVGAELLVRFSFRWWYISTLWAQTKVTAAAEGNNMGHRNKNVLGGLCCILLIKIIKATRRLWLKKGNVFCLTSQAQTDLF